jgi:uncharacterized protein (TIGR02118 family)
MIKVSVLYPNQPGAKFDLDYYTRKHVPLVLDRCGNDVKPGGIDRALPGGAFGLDAPYCVTGHLIFESREAMDRSLGTHMPEFLADIPNFTNIQPVVQISEVVLEHGRRPEA